MGKVTQFVKRMNKDYALRTTVFSGMTFTINFFYAAWQAILAGMFGSLWYGVLAAYYFAFCLVRGFTLNFERLSYKSSGDKFKKSLRYYLFSGLMMLVINAVFVVFAWFTIYTDESSRSSAIPAIGSAAYAVYKLVLAIINAVKAKRYDDYVIRALRNITLMDAVISVFAMEATMMNTFGDGVRGTLYPLVIVSGVAAGLICVTICVYMIAVSAIKLKKLPAADAPDDD